MSAELVERWCDTHSYFNTWPAETVLGFMYELAPDIYDRLLQADPGAIMGSHLAAAGSNALRTLIGDDDPGSAMFKRLKGLIQLAKGVRTCTATLWYLAVDVLALT